MFYPLIRLPSGP